MAKSFLLDGELGSMLDNHILCKEIFESAVCHGMSEKEILNLLLIYGKINSLFR